MIISNLKDNTLYLPKYNERGQIQFLYIFDRHQLFLWNVNFHVGSSICQIFFGRILFLDLSFVISCKDVKIAQKFMLSPLKTFSFVWIIFSKI